MKTKVFLFLMIITLIDSIAIAGTNQKGETDQITESEKYVIQLRNNIANRINYPENIAECNEYKAGIVFSVDESNRIIVHQVLCENDKLCTYLKEGLNGKKVKAHESVINREFYVNIKFKYDHQ